MLALIALVLTTADAMLVPISVALLIAAPAIAALPPLAISLAPPRRLPTVCPAVDTTEITC